MMSGLLNVLIAMAVFLYPIAIYFGLQYLEPRWIALLLAALVVIRSFFARSTFLKSLKSLWLVILVAGLVIAAFSFVQNSTLGLKLYPIIISSSFLAIFSYSLFKPPTVIERIARLQEPDLPEEGIHYTTNVTKIWCVFFIFNILVSLYTVFFTSIEIWTLYNGLISYLLMGLLFFGEFLYRKTVHKSG